MIILNFIEEEAK